MVVPFTDTRTPDRGLPSSLRVTVPCTEPTPPVPAWPRASVGPASQTARAMSGARHGPLERSAGIIAANLERGDYGNSAGKKCTLPELWGRGARFTAHLVPFSLHRL